MQAARLAMRQAERQAEDGYVKVSSAIGPVFVAVGPAGVTAARREEPGIVFEEWYASMTGRLVRPAAGAEARVGPEVEAFMAGEGPAPEVDLSSLPAFDREVLTEVMGIPRGEVRTYGAVARAIGRPGAARAVGSALRRNPIPFLVPCHRVVRGDGHIGEYSGGGSAAKQALLVAEGAL